MNDALWLAFSERVCVEDRVRLVVEALDPAMDRAALARLAERNLATLASIAALEERRSESTDDDNPVLQELGRLDAKLNALVDIVNRLLTPADTLPPRQRLRFNALGALLPSALLPPDDRLLVRVHLDGCPSLPLELPARVQRRLEDGLAFVGFESMSEATTTALDRLVFRLHRRKVAEARQSLT
ncbi:PilZ domain-containing protein [Dyella sp.]|jgi:hypothetical protein|uniref:PilZ domain-containing protein n=1 Tax=Dyella sp. TaxID=1869338 RepID=UPI002D79E41A|nr:PilZ domain-containing protein [Dyella sp.]HET6433839.1 PilZ domain-containing protein [Dyella sp.]